MHELLITFLVFYFLVSWIIGVIAKLQNVHAMTYDDDMMIILLIIDLFFIEFRSLLTLIHCN